jgi:hypothetical protein
MISLEDCIALFGLVEKEVAAIAEHEHLPETAAATLGQFLLRQDQGVTKIRQMIVDDVRAPIVAANGAHTAQLISALHHLLETRSEEFDQTQGEARVCQ